MKITLNWLKRYVEVPWSPQELAERLTMLGIEVEGVRHVAGEFDGVVVAQVLVRDKHPNADKLSLCKVHDGKGERQIVCGATNFKAGDKVPLIFPGSSLPQKPGEKEPFTIKVGKIRGAESHGMLCSPRELGLSDDAEGLLLLREDAVVGQPLAEYLGRTSGDVVYDLEITPNRPDLNSVIGIAREISALTGAPLKLPGTAPLPSSKPSVAECLAVVLDAPDLCSRYTARIVRGVRVGPSPDWLRSLVEKAGLRSINNVVDVTNFVMLESGQPLHAFDYHLVAKAENGLPTIHVRRAAAGETFVTLDGQSRTLQADMLMIADPVKAIALGGVMGGANTEITEKTVDVLIESAWFHPTNIRKTSKSLSLKTDASYRFERGADRSACDAASLRCAQLILETAGGVLAEGVLDATHGIHETKSIALRPGKVHELLGVAIPTAEIGRHLSGLGIVPATPEPDSSSGQPWKFSIPSWRVDLKEEIDLVEEVARMHGVDKIPATPPRGAVGANAWDAVHDQLLAARRVLAGLGLNEAQGQTLISSVSAGWSVPGGAHVALSNPLSIDMDALRPSLLPGLLDALKHNQSRRENDVMLFEIGRVFPGQPDGPKEERRLGLIMTGRRHPTSWSGADRDANVDVYDLKGVLEDFFELWGVRGVVFSKRETPTPLFAMSAALTFGGKQSVGELGQLSSAVAKHHDLRGNVFLAELNFDLLLARRQDSRSFKPIPAFPGIRRDLALVVEESVSHDAVLAVVKQAKPGHLENVELFDVFRGKGVAEGRKSLAYAFQFRHPDRTLTDGEVNESYTRLLARLKESLNASIRE